MKMNEIHEDAQGESPVLFGNVSVIPETRGEKESEAAER